MLVSNEINTFFFFHFSIPSSIFEGIQNYRCLLPPIKDIPKPTHSHTVNEKWVHLDRCIFIPTPVAESKQCGGLKLFQNLSTIFDSSDFCDQQFGMEKIIRAR